MFLIGCAIIFTILSVTILFVAASVWLGQHGGARRWQIWLLYVLSGATVFGAIFMAIPPLSWHTVGLGAGFGALFGAIYGLFAKIPRPTRLRGQRRGATGPHR